MVLQSLTDGGVLVGIPRDLAERTAAHTMMVGFFPILNSDLLVEKEAMSPLSAMPIHMHTYPFSSMQSAAKIVSERRQHPSQVSSIFSVYRYDGRFPFCTPECARARLIVVTAIFLPRSHTHKCPSLLTIACISNTETVSPIRMNG